VAVNGQDSGSDRPEQDDRPAERTTDGGDGWVAGARSAEGRVSATSARPPAPDDDEIEAAAEAEKRPAGAPEPVTEHAEFEPEHAEHDGDQGEEPLDAEVVEPAEADPPAATDPAVPVGPGAAAERPGGAEAARVEPPQGLRRPGPDSSDRDPQGQGRPPGPSGARSQATARLPQATGPVPGPSDLGRRPSRGPAQPARPKARPDATAAELTEDAIVRNRGDRPTQGWRGAMFRVTGGLVNPGVGADERARQEQLRRIRRPLPGSHQIAVSSIKGGVGKTTVSACLGLVLAENRGDRVIALDANPDAGTLADRLTGEASVTVRSLLDNIEATHSLTDVARYTSLAGRLQVLASEQDPAMSEAFDRDEYERVCAVLTRFYNIVITDSGTGLVHSAMEGTLALADSLVVVGAPTVDGASRASKTLDWLIAHGHAAQVANAVVVLSCDRVSKEVDRVRVREHFAARCRAVVEIPHDPHLATGGRIELGRLRSATQDAFLELAAHLADGFGYVPRAAGPSPDPEIAAKEYTGR
jgi:MinD-like ATPase involved in chromosome partitioning or flagellar assembly